MGLNMNTEGDDEAINDLDDIKASISAAMSGEEQPAPAPEADDDETPPMQGFERPRDEQGRFAPKQAAEEPQTPDLRQFVDTTDEPTPGVVEPQQPQYAPPPGWSAAGKVQFDALPAEVKADIAKREQEISDGFRQYADKVKQTEWVDTLFKPYENELHASGLTKEQIVRNWANAEIKLNHDPVGGIRSIMQAYGVTPDMIGAGQPQAPYYGQQQQNPLAQVLTPLQQKLQELEHWKGQQEAIHEARENQRVMTDIERFAADPKHRFFHNVQDTMTQLLTSGMAKGLDDAYKMACTMRDDIRPHLLNGSGPAPQVAAAAKAKQTARSVRSSSGSEQTARTQAPALANHRDDIHQSLREAWQQQTSGV